MHLPRTGFILKPYQESLPESDNSMNGNRIGRKDAQGMQELVSQFIREMKLSSGFNRQRVFEAWNEVSGASRFTSDMFFRNGMLYCTITSSVVRNQLYFQKDLLLRRMNEYLDKDELLVRDGKEVPFVRELILR